MDLDFPCDFSGPLTRRPPSLARRRPSLCRPPPVAQVETIDWPVEACLIVHPRKGTCEPAAIPLSSIRSRSTTAPSGYCGAMPSFHGFRQGRARPGNRDRGWSRAAARAPKGTGRLSSDRTAQACGRAGLRRIAPAPGPAERPLVLSLNPSRKLFKNS